jgi:PIN like domain
VSARARFLFDECIGKPLMESILGLVMTDAEFVHITDYFSQGVKDPDWIPRLAAEGGWVVISADAGKQSKKGDKLPELCWEFGITHVLLSTKLHLRSSAVKASAIASMWNQIEPLTKATPGSRYLLRYKETKGRRGVILVLEDKGLRPETGDGP